MARRIWAVVLVVVAGTGLVVPEVSVGASAGVAPGGGTVATAGSRYQPVTPQRLLDTRRLVGPTNPFSGAVGAGGVRELVVAGVGGIPADATAVVLNVTVTGGSAASDLRAWPAGSPVPTSSNLNWSAGETVANLVTVGVGDGGEVALRNQSGSVHVVVDVQGAYNPAGDRFDAVGPVRVADTRKPAGPGNGLSGALTADVDRELTLAGVSGVPSDASAVVVNLTVTGGSAASDLRVWAAGSPVPGVSNLNWPAGDTRANLAVVPVGTGGRIVLRNQTGHVHLIVDVVGAFSPGAGDLFHPVDPSRLFDTRSPSSPLTGTFGPTQVRDVEVAGVPADATAVVVNLTVTGGSAASDLRAWPAGAPVPTVSNLNWPAGATRPNLAVVPLGADGEISLRNQAGSVHVIADVVGWFVAPSLPPPGPGRWTDITDRLPPLEDVRLEEVSCVSDTFCMAAGERTVATGDTQAMAVVWDGVEWTEVDSPSRWTHTDPTNHDTVHGLSCATPTWCGIAFEWDVDDEYPLLAGVWDGTTWTTAIVEQKGSWEPGADIVCPEAGSCTVFAQGFAAEWDGAAWDRLNFRPFHPVACATAEACVGTADRLAGVVPATWDGEDITDPPAPPGLSPDLVGVAGACASATDCAVLVQDGPGSATALEWDGSEFAHGPPIPAAFDEWRSGSCADPAECVAVVDVDGADHTVRWADGSWTEVGAAPSPEYSCVAGMCMAVAAEDSGTVHPRAWIFLASGAVLGDPGTWTDVSPAPDLFADAVLDELSCTGPDHCVAELDPGYGIPYSDSVLAVWDGASWATEPLPIEALPFDPEEVYNERIEVRGLSCATPTSCGVLMTREIDDQSIWVAAHWDTTEWDLFEIGSLMAEGRTVECADDGTCRVRSDGRFVGDLVWDGDSWSEVAKAPPSGPPAPDTAWPLFPAACAGPDDCTVLGIGYPEAGPIGTWSLVHLHWDGMTWADTGALPGGIVTVAGPFFPAEIVTAAGCASADECLGLFRFTDGEQRALRWDGSSWILAGEGPTFSDRLGPMAGRMECRPGWCMVVGGADDGTVHAPVAWTHTWPSNPG